MDDARKKLLEKIAALRSKTIEAGCTEEEALAAATKVSELLDRYGIDESELRQSEQSDFEQQDYPVFDEVGHRLWKIASAIAKLTDTKSWSDGKKGRPDTAISFFGLTPDVTIAHYLLDICERAVRASVAAYESEVALYRVNVRRRRLTAFIDGMINRLAARIRDIDWARKRAEGEGRGLVVLKMALVDTALQKHGITLTFSQNRTFTDAEPDYAIGQSAADQVRLDAGIEAERAKRVLPIP